MNNRRVMVTLAVSAGMKSDVSMRNSPHRHSAMTT